MKASLIILFFSLLLTACSTNGSRENTMSDNHTSQYRNRGKEVPESGLHPMDRQEQGKNIDE